MEKAVQESLVEAIDILVDKRLNQTKYTSSNYGIVKSVKGFDCSVEMQGDEVACILMEHLHDWIQKDDIVIVQDLYNDSVKKAVIGKVGSTRKTSFTIYDTKKGGGVSGVEQVYDDKKEEEVDVILEIE